jgi:sulfate adenylyltransferase subunit 2
MQNCDTFPLFNRDPGPAGIPPAWNLSILQEWRDGSGGKSERRQLERQITRDNFLPETLNIELLSSITGFRSSVASALVASVLRRRGKVVYLQRHNLGQNADMIVANDGRGGRHWLFRPEGLGDEAFLSLAILSFRDAMKTPLLVFPSASLCPVLRRLEDWPDGVESGLPAYPEHVERDLVSSPRKAAGSESTSSADDSNAYRLTHLDRLEAEAIHIMREVAAEVSNPVMLYSIGKDSAVMLHLALKAFAPGKPPFPLLHVDTGWKFKAMYDFRDAVADATGMKLIIHKNPDGIKRGINPFDHGSALHTDIMKTEALKQALDAHGFDAAFGGARRDEEKSRAKERIFSFRSATHQWDPKNQRPEIWSLYNTRIHKGESMRVFPLSNWTEMDIWHYIWREGISIVPLYFAAPRPVVERDGTLIMADDDRMKLRENEEIKIETVRFRTLGCYPLTGAVPSSAQNIADIIKELLAARTSEREGRVIDRDGGASMEMKKMEGYF